MAFADRIRGLSAGRLPSRQALERLVASALDALKAEAPELRPRDSRGRPGGLLLLPPVPTLVMPDLHGRASFLDAALSWRPPGFGEPMRELMSAGRAQLLCLGDLFHTETGSAPRRWAAAYAEYATGWSSSRAMDEEMGLCLETLVLVLEAKRDLPKAFHYLKGNHDNIANEEGRGDHPFYKFASEGAMVASWFEARYGRELLEEYRELELELPLLALGDRFAASHGEPAFALGRDELVEYRSRPEVVEALIWTRNDEAEEGSVRESLARLLGEGDEAEEALWFAGHRPVDGRYALRARGRFVQFHDPEAWRVAFLAPGRRPDPGRDILDLPRPTR